MIITINEEKIDYTLENEKTAGDIISAIREWLENSGILISEIKLDDKIAPLHETNWENTDLQNISVIALKTITLKESRIRQIETALNYFNLLVDAADKNDLDTIGELSEGFSDLTLLLNNIFGDLDYKELAEGIVSELNEHGFPVTDSSVYNSGKDIIADSENFIKILESRLNEISNPGEEAVSAAGALASMADELENVAVNLQTGKEMEAMQTIILLTELMQALLRSMSWSDVTEETENYVSEIFNILSELEEALKASDTVLIGDLLEYELKPKLLELPPNLNFKEN